MLYRNPYLNRSMIRSVDGFYGRQRELGRLIARLGATPPQSVSLVGERRIGKSSLLWHASRPEVYARFLGEAGQYLFLLLDFQGLRHVDLAGFCQTFSRHLADVAPQGLATADADSLDGLEKQVRRCADAGLRLVCLFDEFETIAASPVFGPEFFGFLRSLANAHPLALVTASRQPLHALCHTREIAESPFFNIFAEVPLGPFTAAEAGELIAGPSAHTDFPLESHGDALIELAGCLPFFLQVACSAAFECLAEAGDERLDGELLERRFREEADSHFHYLWEHFDTDQRTVLATVLENRTPAPPLDAAARALAGHGYLRDGPGGLAPFSRALLPFLAENDLLSSVSPAPATAPRADQTAATPPDPATAAAIDPVPIGARPFPALVGSSEPLRCCLALMERAAASDATVLLLGETGTGKELVARSVHGSSRRAGRPFVVVNCGAIAENLQETELFGHKRGAFTGAVADRAGLFEAADGGTLLLDEVAETTPATQAKLLRVLQEGEIRRVGENESRRVDVRVLAATNRDLTAEVTAGRFRQDLYYRLHVLVVPVPALRERRGDIPELIGHFAGGGEVRDDALQQLCAYDWPGNVRELENQIASAHALAGGAPVEPRHLWQHVQRTAAAPAAAAPDIGPEVPLRAARESFERGIIEARLRHFDWDADRTARSLDISRSRLYDLLRKYGLRREDR